MNENLMHSEVCTPLFLNIEDEKVRRMFFQDVIKIMNENLYYSEVFMYSLFLHLWGWKCEKDKKQGIIREAFNKKIKKM